MVVNESIKHFYSLMSIGLNYTQAYEIAGTADETDDIHKEYKLFNAIIPTHRRGEIIKWHIIDHTLQTMHELNYYGSEQFWRFIGTANPTNFKKWQLRNYPKWLQILIFDTLKGHIGTPLAVTDNDIRTMCDNWCYLLPLAEFEWGDEKVFEAYVELCTRMWEKEWESTISYSWDIRRDENRPSRLYQMENDISDFFDMLRENLSLMKIVVSARENHPRSPTLSALKVIIQNIEEALGE